MAELMHDFKRQYAFKAFYFTPYQIVFTRHKGSGLCNISGRRKREKGKGQGDEWKREQITRREQQLTRDPLPYPTKICNL